MPKPKNVAQSQNAKPFLKWAGGKSQLLRDIELLLPERVRSSRTINLYIEPFIGGGALLFHLKNTCTIHEAVILDINPELILTYKVLQKRPDDLIAELQALRREFHQCETPLQREALFYRKRNQFNEQRVAMDHKHFDDAWITRAALLIFLNKTCFNGLFRLNRGGGFNVPFGQYKKPVIFTEKNIRDAHQALQNTHIKCGDFNKSRPYVTPGAVIYLDPPYRPLNRTSNFTDYSTQGFTDHDQRRLSKFFRDMDQRGASLILSNSDPRNANHDDHFFDELYQGYSILRVRAYRSINCISAGRGKINEILVTNSPPPEFGAAFSPQRPLPVGAALSAAKPDVVFDGE